MKPEFGIIKEHKDNHFTHIVVDTKKATYGGYSWYNLGDFGRRKLENVIFFSRGSAVKVHYV